MPPEAAAPTPTPIMGYRPMPAVRGVVSDHLIERPSGIYFKVNAIESRHEEEYYAHYTFIKKGETS